MIDIAVQWVAMSALLAIAASVLKSVEVRSWPWAFAGAAVFGALNVALGWIMVPLAKLIGLPVAIMTLGISNLLVPIAINMLFLYLADRVTKDHVKIKGLLPLAILSVVVTVGGYFIHKIMHMATAA